MDGKQVQIPELILTAGDGFDPKCVKVQFAPFPEQCLLRASSICTMVTMICAREKTMWKSVWMVRLDYFFVSIELVA